MEGTEVLDIGRDGFMTLLAMATPIMLVGLGVGLVIAFFQALTQIQEMTLTFVPKIIAIFFALIVLLPTMGNTMGSFMDRIEAHIVEGR